MKIDSSAKSLGNLQKSTGSRTAAAPAKSADAAANNSSSTVVAASIHHVADTEPAFNAAKVAEIRQAIAEGRFQINAEKIADGLIASVREMLAQNRRSTS